MNKERLPNALRGACKLYRMPAQDPVQQIIYALQRAETMLRRQADQLLAQRDYSAEFPYEDAQRMVEAQRLLSVIGNRTPLAALQELLNKAEAFDALCKTAPPGEYIGSRNVPVAGDPTKERIVSVFQWEFRARGTRDFREACMQLVKKENV